MTHDGFETPARTPVKEPRIPGIYTGRSPRRHAKQEPCKRHTNTEPLNPETPNPKPSTLHPKETCEKHTNSLVLLQKSSA